MKIAVIGAGAMGSLYGGYLSQHNDVYLIDTDPQKIDKIVKDGIRIKEISEEKHFYPNAVVDSSVIGKVDLIIIFVKAMFSKNALECNKHLIGENTYVMTLQNGSGHEEILKEYVAKEHIIIGTTQHNSSIIEPGFINHGAAGKTNIGLLNGNCAELEVIAKTFEECGFETEICDNIQKLIWKKLFTNVSASVLTGVLQVKLGFILDNAHAWFLAERLIKEAVAVAKGDGIYFDEDEVIEDVKAVLVKAHEGYTSIYSDIRSKCRTEVDTINGSVVRASKRNGVPAPCHEFIVELVHAIEDK